MGDGPDGRYHLCRIGCTGPSDPLANLAEPPQADGPCDRLPLVSGSAEPGVYCGGFNVVADTVMQPGLYVIRDGNFIVGNNTKLSGEGVTIYLQGNVSIQMSGSADVRLKAPTSGPLAGIVIVSDRDPATLAGLPLGLPHLITGNSVKAYEGAIYLPRGHIVFQGASKADTPSPFSIFIAHKISLIGAAKMVINNEYSASDVPLPGTMGRDQKARLVE